MKITMLSRHGCFRVMKEALPLIARGHDVHLIVNKVTQGAERFKSVTVYQSTDQLQDAIRQHKDTEVWHAHNEPAWFVTVVKDTGHKAPVILDIHDSHLLRKTPQQEDEEQKENPESFRVSIDERNNFQLADAIVYCCEPMRKIVGSEFKLNQPNIVLPSFLPKEFYRIDFMDWMGGLVYEGRIDIPDELPKKWSSFFRYSDYIELAKKCREIGMDFHIYTPRENAEVKKIYGEISYMHEPKNVDKLIKHLGSFDWGLVGNIRPHEEWKNALPNKLFEYWAGCTPVVAINAEESARWILEYDAGIVVDSMEELASRWSEHTEKRKNVIKCRSAFQMENHIHKVEELYKQAIEATRPMEAIVPLREVKNADG